MKSRNRSRAALSEDDRIFAVSAKKGLTFATLPCSVSGMDLMTFTNGSEGVDGLNQSPLQTFFQTAPTEVI